MSKLTYVSNGSDWEALYVDGEKVADQHLNRLWPHEAFKIIEEHDVDETEVSEYEPKVGEPFPTNLSELENE